MSNEIVLQQPDEGELKGKGAQLVDQANDLAITTPDEYEHAGEWLVEIKGVGKRLLERFSDPCSKALSAWKSMTAMRDEAMKPFTSAELIVKRKMAAFQFEIEEARRRDEQRKAAQAQAEAEKKRLKDIEEARKMGDREAVKNLKEAPLEVQAAPSKLPEAPKVAGVSYRKVWKVSHVNAAMLPARYLIPDMKAIEATVRGLGAKHGISGVTVTEETVTSVRS